MLARSSIEPVIPMFDVIADIIESGEINHEVLRGGIAYLALKGDLLSVYIISQIVNREVSILIDADHKVWVDWGGQSSVKLHPPAGSSIPYRLWIHTHPRGDAYWSDTDKVSIAGASTILESALVLGNNGILFTSYNDDELIPGLTDSGPLSRWSIEEVQSWEEQLVTNEEVSK